MSDDDNSGESLDQNLRNTMIQAITQDKDTEMIQTIDTEMTTELASAFAARPEPSNVTVIARYPTTQQEECLAVEIVDTTPKDSGHVKMDSEPSSLTEELIESPRGNDATRLPIQSVKPDPAAEDTRPGDGDLPTPKQSRQDEDATEMPATKPARKVYRGIGSVQGALAVNDRLSYALRNVTIEQQAAREPDFVGEAYIHDLRYNHVQEMLEGSYVIVYSRASSNSGLVGSFETYSPSITKRTLEIFSLGPATPPRAGKGQVYKGDWIEGEFSFNDYFCLFKAHQRFSEDGTAALCTVQEQKGAEESQSGMLNNVLEFGSRKSGSNICFGMKHMRKIEEHGKWPVYLGFEFVVLNLATWDVTTSEHALQRIIGIKIPPKREVASGFLLNQVLRWPADMSHLVHRPGFRQARPSLRDSQNKREVSGPSGNAGKSWTEKAAASGVGYKKV